MRKHLFLTLFIGLLILVMLTSCSFISKTKNKKQIVTTLYPQYDMVEKILGNNPNIAGIFELKMIVPPGQDSHTYDPSVNDLITIKNADLFIYTSDEMETWVKDIEFSSKTKVVNLAHDERIELVSVEDEDHNEHETSEPSHEHNHAHNFDPHYWVYPIFAAYMVENITKSIIDIIEDPYGTISKEFNNNANIYIAELHKIDEKIKNIVSLAQSKTMYFGCPFSFYYWSIKYGLEYELTYATCSTETEPSISVLTNIINKMKANNVKYIFSKELVNKEACETIAYHTNAIILEMHSGHNVSTIDFNNPEISFLTILNKNADHLALMLGVDEKGGN